MSYMRNSSTHTLDKCQKILRMFQQIGNQPERKKPDTRPTYTSKHASTPYYLSQSTTKMSHSRPTFSNTMASSKSLLKNNSNSLLRNSSKSALKNNLTLINQHQSTTNQRPNRQSTLFRQKSNSSFVSCYNKNSRLDQIMKLKVSKPQIRNHNTLKSQSKTMLLNTSLSSLNSSRSTINKQNINFNRSKESRLEKIMNIKVEKPKVNSTLVGYEPKKCQRSLSKSMNKKSIEDMNSVLQLKDCRKKIRKSEQIEQKQDRLWRVFEREREQQLKDKRKHQEQCYKGQRRQEEKFQKLVQKELKKIQNSRQISLRKQKVFSQYAYPTY